MYKRQGGSIGSLTAVSDKVYRATFTPTADSTTDGVISVASSKFSDSAGNENTDGSESNNTLTLGVDTVRPTIAITSAASSLKAGETTTVTFTLSDPILSQEILVFLGDRYLILRHHPAQFIQQHLPRHQIAQLME